LRKCKQGGTEEFLSFVVSILLPKGLHESVFCGFVLFLIVKLCSTLFTVFDWIGGEEAVWSVWSLSVAVHEEATGCALMRSRSRNLGGSRTRRRKFLLVVARVVSPRPVCDNTFRRPDENRTGSSAACSPNYYFVGLHEQCIC